MQQKNHRSISLLLFWKCFLLICLPLWTLPTFVKIKKRLENKKNVKNVKNVTKIKKRFFTSMVCISCRTRKTPVHFTRTSRSRAVYGLCRNRSRASATSRELWAGRRVGRPTAAPAAAARPTCTRTWTRSQIRRRKASFTSREVNWTRVFEHAQTIVYELGGAGDL